MDLANQTEVLLREAGYETWPWTFGTSRVVCFEDQTLVGFVHFFQTETALAEEWERAQQLVLSRYGSALRTAGAKAWNVYSVFLTGSRAGSLKADIERIEEDFSLARKIARSGIENPTDLQQALLPLLPVTSRASIGEAHYVERLQTHLKDVSPGVVSALLGTTAPTEIARMLVDAS